MYDQSMQPHSPYQGDARGGGESPIRLSERWNHPSSAHLKARERETEEDDLNTNLKESHKYWGKSKGAGPSDV
jgi:hypothetical protein